MNLTDLYCPACGSTLAILTLDDGPELLCNSFECPRPTAAAEILADREVDHIATLDEHGFTLRHPLAERLDGALLDCSLHDHLTEYGHLYAEGHDLAPARIGRFRIEWDPAREWLRWTPLDPAPSVPADTEEAR